VPESELASTRAAPVRDGQRPYFLFVGRLEAMKGLQEVIPHFGENAPADLLVAGSGAYEPELRRLAAGSTRVRFLGQTSSEDLQGLYRDALALIAPSLGFEVFPMVVLEAFCRSTPVIARNVGPYPQLIEESGGGLLFGDGQELRVALDRIAADSELRALLGARGRRAVETRWSEQTATSAYLELVGATAATRTRVDIVSKVDRMSMAAGTAESA
jgi:glycosyltransferase involved in cell wall biosynthesis